MWVWQKLAEKLQAYAGKLNFAMDTWTAPNHKSFTAITVHLEDEGVALSLPLNVVKVARVSDIRTSILWTHLTDCCSHIPAQHWPMNSRRS